jgi:DNA-binding NarL/FixJ family response regulator
MVDMAADRIRILLAEDHRAMRETLRAMIDREPEMEVLAGAADGREAVRLAAEYAPDLVIMDVRMPEMDGIEATRRVVSEGDGVKVLALSMYSDRQVVADMFDAGASGYMLKDSAFEELVRAIRKVAGNGTYLDPAIEDARNDKGGARPNG